MKNVTGYVNAGGRGTRLNGVFQPHETLGVTKALLTVGNPPLPLVEHQVNRLLRAGVRNVVVSVGDHAHVAEYVTARYNGTADVRALGVLEQLGTGGDLVQLYREYGAELFARHILVVNCDTVLRLHLRQMIRNHRDRGARLTIALTRKDGVPNQDAYYVAESGAVVYCEEVAPAPTEAVPCAYRASSTGVVILKSALLRAVDWSPIAGPLSLYRDIVAAAMRLGNVYAHDNARRFFIDVGTTTTWAQISRAPELLQRYLCYSPTPGRLIAAS